MQEDSKNPKAALIVIDQQRDFEPGGALAVENGDAITAPISRLMQEFKTVVLTQDSHPKGHISFASTYPSKKPFELLTLRDFDSPQFETKIPRETVKTYLNKIPNQSQILWPDHCVVGTGGWEFDPNLLVEKADLILRKGTRLDCDSYSAFFENDGTSTGLSAYLKARGIESITTVGLAGDYCVYWSAKDARREGFNVFFDESLTRFVNFPEKSREKALADLKEYGVRII